MEFLKNYWPTIVMLLGMGGWFVFRWKKNFYIEVEKNPFGDYPQPKNAQTWGVLGTFIGIALGLLGFDAKPEHMHDSVMSLISGMSTAFLTSIAGMGMYLWLNNYQDNAKKKAEEELKDSVDDDANIADLIRYMKEEDAQHRSDGKAMLAAMRENNQVLGDTISKAIADVQRSVVGDGDYTVIGQMKQIRLEHRDEITKLRDEARHSNEELIKEFREFAKTMAENNTKAFIEALNETMKDFNTKLTEQFGENFKQLNEAVGRLLDWQIQYKETVEEVTNTQREIFDGIENVRESMQHMEESSAAMTESANKMSDLIVTATIYNEKLEQALTELHRIGADAQQAAKDIVSLVNTSSTEIENYTKNTMEEMNSMADSLKENSNLIADNSNKALKALNQHTQNTIRSMENVSNALHEAAQKAQQDFTAQSDATHDSVRKAADALHRNALNITKDISDQLNEMMKTNNENLKKSSENLAKDLDNKITNSLESMGNAMGSISQKFAEDYLPIAKKLKEIVDLANGNYKRR